MKKIVQYLAGFNVKTNSGAITLKLEGGGELPLRGLSPEQFNSYMLVLSNEPVYFDAAKGWVQTGYEIPMD